MPVLEQRIVDTYEGTYTKMMRHQLQQQKSHIEPYATPVGKCNGKMYRLPFTFDTAEMNVRQQRYQKIVADEPVVTQRWMSKSLYERFRKMSTDDEKFLDNIPINAKAIIQSLTKAAVRVKDYELFGTIKDTREGSATRGFSIVRGVNTIDAAAVNGSPYKGGSTGGIFGDNYGGERGEIPIPLPIQPMLNSGTAPIEEWTQFAKAAWLDKARTNVIPVNYKLGGTLEPTGMTIEKLVAVGACYMARYSEGGVIMGITPQQVMELQMEDKLQNSLYGFQSLRTGWVQELLGIHFVVTPAVPIVNIGTESAPKWVRACPVWRKEDLVFGIWEDAKFHVRPPVGDNLDELLYGVTFGMGAARLTEETFLTVLCDEGLGERPADSLAS